MTAADFQRIVGVSRETQDKFDRYAAMLTKWTAAINLISPRSLPDLWRRHFLDAAQLRQYLPDPKETAERTILDLGSGGGFPGLVLSILGCGHVHLVESDQRKAVFLREVARETGARATVHAVRVEALDLFPVDAVTCRAFAPLPKILDLSERFLRADCGKDRPIGLFLKGRNVDQELTEAGKTWRLQTERFESITDPEGSILRLKLLPVEDSAS
ncbi:16S rRNA (guanine(527)-N(7))-methyltransferase RsmG [Pelagibius litoralis]|uniref:16S rRNA (guanine(527)-N(7))-methyltransferase RsmG n=1 Tax=Pelagibius litoralis TaxID=374515 RepID=UPI003F5806CB